MGIIDSHAHYDDPMFDRDRDILLSSLEQNGIEAVINAGTDSRTGVSCKKLADKYAFIYFAAGIHPSEVGEILDGKAEIDIIRDLLSDKKAVAVGEIGLDYHYGKDTATLQKEWFDLQLSLSEEMRLPVVIHDREAHGDCMDILSAHPSSFGVFHSFSGSREMASQLVKKGWMLSFNGVLTFKNAHKVREVASFVPQENILIETDCPYLSPVPYRGERNSSLNLPLVIRELAFLRMIDPQEVVNVTSENARLLFSL